MALVGSSSSWSSVSHRARLIIALAILVAALAPAAPASAGESGLRAGVGRADITPPTGYAFGGWTRADRIGRGVHTRLYASVLVLERDGRKVALVAGDLFAAPGGLVKEAADMNAARGFSERNVMMSVSHTHAGPSGFANFSTLNTLAPSLETINRPETFVELLAPRPADPQLYTFLARRIALAIRRADQDLGPAAAGWGVTSLPGITRNRSLEAHLANHDVIREFGQGRVEEDPDGAEHTIDPEVNVLRVDRVVVEPARRCRSAGRRPASAPRPRSRRRRPAFTGAVPRCAAPARRVRVPMGAWSTFANHGTVNPAEYGVYNQDHHGAALRVFESAVRRAGRVPAGRPVINVYGNSDEGDQSAGLDGRGPAVADRVGRAEAGAMLRAWRQAGSRLSEGAEVDLRWTRVCFCGQETADGPVDSRAVPGVPFLTGSEEGRGPLFDITRTPLEGQRSPVGSGPQGHKLGLPVVSESSYPKAVPLFVVRVADRLVISFPGEATVEVGRRARAAVLQAAAGRGFAGAVVAGLANEYIQYFTTPEEYDRQHYEGGSTEYGRASSTLLTEQLAELTGNLARGEPAQEAYAFDPRNGVEPNGQPFGTGSESGSILRQADAAVPPGAQAVFIWQGGPRGFDRPLDTPFVTIQREDDGRWRTATDDLGLQIVWTVDDDGRYRMHWEVPRDAASGTYRVVVTANRYRLRGRPFRVDPTAVDPGTDPDHPAARFAPIGT
jgi:hypothetical protein